MNIPKQKKCKVCGDKFTPIRSLLEPVCSRYECKVEFALKVAEKSKLNREKAVKKKNLDERKKLKESLMTLTDYEKEAKKVFQRYIRLRDADLPCISCGNSKTNDWAGGHFFPAGIFSGLIFDERNCNKQCNTYCNKHLSGNLLEYRKGLIKRFGLEFVEKLEEESNSKRNYKYTKQELIAKKLQYEIKIKELINRP